MSVPAANIKTVLLTLDEISKWGICTGDRHVPETALERLAISPVSWVTRQGVRVSLYDPAAVRGVWEKYEARKRRDRESHRRRYKKTPRQKKPKKQPAMASTPAGTRFNRLTTTTMPELVPLGSRNQWAVEAKCDCGETKTYRLQNLVSGNTKSCGCLADEIAANLRK